MKARSLRSAPVLGALGAFVVHLGVSGCHRRSPLPEAVPSPIGEAVRVQSSGGVAGEPAAVRAGEPDATRALPQRCRASAKAAALTDAGGLGDLEIGDAVAVPGGGYALGVVHRSAASRMFAVALLAEETLAVQEVVDLQPASDSAQAPLLVARAKDLLVAVLRPIRGRPPGGARPDLVVYSIGNGRPKTLLGSVARPRDDMLAVDMASDGQGAVVLWEGASGPEHGVVLASATPTTSVDHPSPPGPISPPDADADLPRVVSTGGGYRALWIAHRVDVDAVGDSSALEVTGERRSFGWLQTALLDAHGALVGRTLDLTSRAGHVSAFDARVLSDRAGAVLVVARDDGERVDGSGGSLLQVTAQASTASPATPIQVDGLGRGAPTLVSGNPPWLAWAGSDEQLRLMPLNASGQPTERESVEEGMSAARPLMIVSPPSATAETMLVATPSDGEAQVRVFECKNTLP